MIFRFEVSLSPTQELASKPALDASRTFKKDVRCCTKVYHSLTADAYRARRM